ncbi:hypothetical protein [Methylobacterium sp. Leaf361]|uniref:hypothetical protein n=1 Tax=Methylobacterium sp. Leaf361 TaxID=1736352 RepID=UPI000AB279B9|nr:hypothetical protein [Methylobacterium sp. Leaf361]
MSWPAREAIVPATFETVTIVAGSASQTAFDIEEQRARIERAHEETRKFVAEQHKPIAEQSNLAAEQTKLAAEQFKMTAEASKTAVEQTKLAAEAAKIGRDRGIAPWQVALFGMTAGVALFGAGTAFVKLLGP